MSKNINQVYIANPSTTAANNDLIYLGKSPYAVTDDSAIKYSDFIAQINNGLFAAANTYYVDPAGSNANNGSQNAPYSDPFFASDSITGSVANPKLIVINSGIYSTSNFEIKPNISFIGGSSQSTLDDNGTITLDSSWSSAAAFSYACFRGFDWNGSWNLDFNSASYSTGVLIYEYCYIETITITGSVAAIIYTGGSVGTLNLVSTSSTFNSVDIQASVTISSGSASGNKTNEFIACNFNSSSNITVSGASGKVQTLIIKSSPIRGTLTVDGTFVTLRIDATSIPQGGITFINGATDSQVNLIGNAPAKSLNNAYVGQNYVTPVSISSSAGTLNWNLNSPSVKTTLTENTTIAAPTNQIEGACYLIKIVQDSTPRTVTWNSAFKWTQTVAPVMSTGSGAVDLYGFYSDGTNLRQLTLSQNTG